MRWVFSEKQLRRGYIHIMTPGTAYANLDPGGKNFSGRNKSRKPAKGHRLPGSACTSLAQKEAEKKNQGPFHMQRSMRSHSLFPRTSCGMLSLFQALRTLFGNVTDLQLVSLLTLLFTWIRRWKFKHEVKLIIHRTAALVRHSVIGHLLSECKESMRVMKLQ